MNRFVACQVKKHLFFGAARATMVLYEHNCLLTRVSAAPQRHGLLIAPERCSPACDNVNMKEENVYEIDKTAFGDAADGLHGVFHAARGGVDRKRSGRNDCILG